MSVIQDEDFYFEGDLMVMTANYHLKRGYCCGSGCRHCPYFPKHEAGSRTLIDGSLNCHEREINEMSEKREKA